MRGSGPLRAPLAGHVGAGPFWGGGGEGRRQGTGRTPERTERGAGTCGVPAPGTETGDGWEGGGAGTGRRAWRECRGGKGGCRAGRPSAALGDPAEARGLAGRRGWRDAGQDRGHF